MTSNESNMTPEGAPEKKISSVVQEGTPTKATRRPLSPKTTYAKNGEGSVWKIVDAKNQRLGRLSAYIAHVLMGKNKPHYTPFSDMGDSVIIINADKVVLTGSKWKNKLYQHHTNYAGGIKTRTAEEVYQKDPTELIRLAVYRMMPKGPLCEKRMKKMKIFAGPQHTHQAQCPTPLVLPALV